MPNLIPPQSRDLVQARDMDQCVRCGGRGTSGTTDVAARVVDEHQHCP